MVRRGSRRAGVTEQAAIFKSVTNLRGSIPRGIAKTKEILDMMEQTKCSGEPAAAGVCGIA
jgi:hypothetical protein